MMFLFVPYSEYLTKLREPRNLIDIVLVFIIVYALLKLVRGTRAVPMAAGIAAVALLYWFAVYQELATLEFILRGALLYIGVAIIVLFQTEIRQALITFGNRFRLPFTRRHGGQFGEGVYDEIILAATSLSSNRIGALIVIERNIGLKNVIDGGVKLDAELTYDLLVTIFNTTTPLHDGAVIVRGHRIAAAACFLPLTLNPRLSKDMGTRHRAAIGITEDTDAVAVVVSEETGLISFVKSGQIKRALDANKLRELIFQALEVQRVLPKPREKEKTMHDTDMEDDTDTGLEKETKREREREEAVTTS